MATKKKKQDADGAGSALLDSDAKEKLKKAARYVGLSVAQLVDLAYHHGALTPGEKERGVSNGLTLGDLGKRMWGDLQKVMQGDRARWFHELLEPQQVALIATLMDQGYRPEVIGLELQVPSVRVREIMHSYADKIGFQVTEMRLTTIAGNLQQVAERAMEGLLQSGDFKGYFMVEKQRIELLQSLGIVDRAIQRLEVTHKDETGSSVQNDIEAMIEIERKRQARIEEIGRSGEVQMDEVPELAFEKED